MRTISTPLLLSLSLAACGSGAPPAGDDGSNGGPDAQDLSDHMEPWVVGSDWTYATSDPRDGSKTTQHTTVEAYEDVGGKYAGTMAFRVKAGKPDEIAVAWEGYVGDKGVRYKEDDYDLQMNLVKSEVWDPPRLKVDQTPANLADGATYSETYSETTTPPGDTKQHTMNWTVVSTHESVTVPAGTFTVLHVKRTDTGNGKVREYFFAEGVGKVKEIGDNEIDEMSAYQTP
jgi:hypothetical protein